MKLNLRRSPTPTATQGRLYVEGVFECDTLEDPERSKKVTGKTAIPRGTYPVKITWSPRFKCEMPLLEGVPNFSGVRIHPGNTVDDTEGCILVGARDGERLKGGTSRPAYARLFAKLKAAQDRGEQIELTIGV